MVPRPLMHLGEDTGLCAACNMVYDARLYEMRLHQHKKDFNYDSLDAYFREMSPIYRRLVGAGR